jgi:signal transduction histidine kinase
VLLNQLIEDILELSRLDAGIKEGEHRSLDLAELTERILADLQPLAEEKRIGLAWQRPISAVMTVGDPARLARVVRNLVDNAIKYTPVGGSVKVMTALELIDEREFATIWVEDTGIGIPAEYQSRVFDRFYRLDPSHTVPGTGLGLSIVKEIVNAHDGSIQLKSRPGAGSTFIVRLPGLG